MLPNRPSPRHGTGLPSGPRSYSVGRSRKDEPSTSHSREQSSRSNDSPSSRQVRPQRSIASVSIARDRYEALPPVPQRQNFGSNTSSRPYESPSMYRKESDTSSSSNMSTTSSFLDRLKGAGDTSSRTSLDEEYQPPIQKQWRGQESGQARQDSRSFEEDGREDSALAPGVGYTLWSHLTSAASTLGVDVSKAWVTNISVDSGEETRDKESRLTQVMKAYHIEKARDPTDLPSWLFQEHERRPSVRARFASRQNSREEDRIEEYLDVPRLRGLRDIYDAAAVLPIATSRISGTSDKVNRFADLPVIPSKATNRLKALRDVKRQNSRLGNDSLVKINSHSGRRDVGDGKRHDSRGAESRPRVGLPSRPGGGPRMV